MTKLARRARQQAQEAAETQAMVEVGEVESHSPTPSIMQGCGRRNRVVVDIVSFQEGSVIDLTSTGTVRVTESDEEK
ncbi:Peptidyl-prolyl cis-trans isomerase CYP40 [Hordeum vulgare]|nr:Peptidyl-prolyl cis-trans isomerase CYP40 [Hordeum vulgare]